MSHYSLIHDVSKQFGVTSRTLRHWEEKGLFNSQREPQSGWRIYDEEALQRIRLSVLFRELDIPLKDVSSEYGWAACITVPEQVIIPEYLEEKRLPTTYKSGG